MFLRGIKRDQWYDMHGLIDLFRIQYFSSFFLFHLNLTKFFMNLVIYPQKNYACNRLSQFFH